MRIILCSAIFLYLPCHPLGNYLKTRRSSHPVIPAPPRHPRPTPSFPRKREPKPPSTLAFDNPQVTPNCPPYPVIPAQAGIQTPVYPRLRQPPSHPQLPYPRSLPRHPVIPAPPRHSRAGGNPNPGLPSPSTTPKSPPTALPTVTPPPPRHSRATPSLPRRRESKPRSTLAFDNPQVTPNCPTHGHSPAIPSFPRHPVTPAQAGIQTPVYPRLRQPPSHPQLPYPRSLPRHPVIPAPPRHSRAGGNPNPGLPSPSTTPKSPPTALPTVTPPPSRHSRATPSFPRRRESKPPLLCLCERVSDNSLAPNSSFPRHPVTPAPPRHSRESGNPNPRCFVSLTVRPLPMPFEDIPHPIRPPNSSKERRRCSKLSMAVTAIISSAPYLLLTSWS